MSSSGQRTHLRLLTVGDFDPQTDQAIAELQQAYAAMPDPVVHRTGRDLVLSSLRGVHLERYRQSGQRVDLCATQPPAAATASPSVSQRPVMAERPPAPAPLHPPIDTARQARRYHGVRF